MQLQTIRVGIVGAGANVRERHAPGFRAIDGVEIVAVCNRTRESSERAASELGISRVHDNWLELVEDDEVDAVCIGTWPDSHCPITLAALARGKHVLAEARMALNAGEARAMLDASRAAPHLVAQVVPAPYTLDFDQTIQHLIAEDYLGDLLAISVRISPGTFADNESPLHWRQDREISGFNTLALGIWYESLLRWVGPATRVLALTKVVVNQRKDANGAMRTVSVPDHIDVLCEMACGAQAHFQISAVTGFARSGVWLYGRDGTLFLDTVENALRGGRTSDRQLNELEIPAESRGGWRVEEEFINSIRGIEKVTHTTFDDGVKYMEFTEAVARSAQSGGAVSLPL